MRYWRLLVVSFLLTFSIAGCHHKAQRALPPPQAQAPVVAPMPTLPPLDLDPVILAQSPAPPPTAPPPVEAPPPRKRAAKSHRHHAPSKDETDGESTEMRNQGGSSSPAAAPATAIIGQLSADDASATPSDAAQTKHLIDSTEGTLKKLSTQQQTQHKDAVAQVYSFLAQARQALSMNDVVGAQTLANKAKILVDELAK